MPATTTAATIFATPPNTPSTSALNRACRSPMKIESVSRLIDPATAEKDKTERHGRVVGHERQFR